jgi:hypothetical protein
MASDRSLVVGVAAALAAVIVAAPAGAQERPRLAPTPSPFGQVRIGVLTFTPTANLTNIGIDSNVFDFSGTERRSPDFTMTLEPGVETRMTTRRLDARVATTVGLVYYRKYASERAVNPRVVTTIDQRMNDSLSFYAKSDVGYTKERSGLEIDSRPRSLSHGSTVGARLGERKLEFDLHGSFGEVAYDPNARFLNVRLADTLDMATTSGGLGVKYRLSPYTAVSTVVDATATRFEYSPERDTNSYLASMNLEFHPRAMLAGTAGIGYRVMTPTTESNPDFAGFTPRVGLSYRLKDVFSAGVGIQRDVERSFYADRSHYLYTLYEASVRQALFHHLDVGGSFQYTTLDYRQFLLPGQPLNELPTEVVRMTSANIGMPIMRGFRAGAYIQRWERVSGTRPYASIRAGLELTIGQVSLSPRGVFLNGPGR